MVMMISKKICRADVAAMMVRHVMKFKAGAINSRFKNKNRTFLEE